MMQIKRIFIVLFIRAFVPLMAQSMNTCITLEDVQTAASYYRSQSVRKKLYRTAAYALGGIVFTAGTYILYREWMAQPEPLKTPQDPASRDHLLHEKDIMVIADYIHQQKTFKHVIRDAAQGAVYSAFAMFFGMAMYQGWNYVVHGWRKLHSFLHEDDQVRVVQQAMLTAGNIIVETLQRYQKHLATYGTDESIMISSHRDFLVHEIIEQHRAYMHMLIDCLGLMCVLHEKRGAGDAYDQQTWQEHLTSIIDLHNTYFEIIAQDIAFANNPHHIDAAQHMIFTAERWFDQLTYRLTILNT